MLLDAGNIKLNVTEEAFPPLLSHSGGGRWATSMWMLLQTMVNALVLLAEAQVILDWPVLYCTDRQITVLSLSVFSIKRNHTPTKL